MPTYDYSCTNCSHKFEAFQKITDEPLKECPNCHKMTVERGFGGGNALFRFQGSGFYLTDYCQNKEGGCSSCKKD